MIAACALPIGAPSLARDILASTDCLITGRIQSAYAALLAPGGTFVSALTIALTIYVAIVGYRLILGYNGLTLRELVPHFVKIGVVLALATSWPSYQVLVFDLLFHGPEQLADAITARLSDSPATGQGDVLTALQNLFDRITDYASDAWAQVGPAPVPPPIASSPTMPVVPATPIAGGAPLVLPFQLGAAQFVSGALWLAALTMMAASVGVLLVVRIVLALLLVLGPVFIACALFSPTRGLFEGWLRTTVKFAAVPLFTLPLAAAMVAVVLPFIDRLEDAPIESFRDGPTLAILLIVMVFAAVLFQAVRLAGGIASGIRIPRRGPVSAATGDRLVLAGSGSPVASPLADSRAGMPIPLVRGSASGGRDAGLGSVPAGMLMATRSIGTLAPPVSAAMPSAARLGQGYRRLVVGNAPRPTRTTGA